jgi:hypothetical protein
MRARSGAAAARQDARTIVRDGHANSGNPIGTDTRSTVAAGEMLRIAQASAAAVQTADRASGDLQRSTNAATLPTRSTQTSQGAGERPQNGPKGHGTGPGRNKPSGPAR